MKLIFMGTPDFSVGTLEALIEAGHTISLVVSQPDKPKGRGHEMMPTPVKEVALKYNLPVFQPVKVREESALEVLRNTEADAIVVVAFGQILPKTILDMKKYGCINVHASLLPKYRGAAPIQWAVIDGEKESGVSIQQMNEGIDTGDVLYEKVIPLDEKETGGSLFDKLSLVGGQACVEALELLEQGKVEPRVQGDSPTPYAKMLTKEMGCIDFGKSAAEIERLIRGLNPWPSAYTRCNGKTLKVWAAEVLEDAVELAPGTVAEVTKDSIHVACGQGVLVITELQLEGKKRMDAGAFLRGYQVSKGTVLG